MCTKRCLYIAILVVITSIIVSSISILAYGTTYKVYCDEWKEDSKTTTINVNLPGIARGSIRLWAYVGAYDNGLYLYDIEHKGSVDVDIKPVSDSIMVIPLFYGVEVDYPSEDVDKSFSAYTKVCIAPIDGLNKCLIEFVNKTSGSVILVEIPCACAIAYIESGTES